MDELDLIRNRAETIGFAPPEHLAPARERLLAAARGERRHRPRRWFWLAGASAGLAAAITAVVALAPADQVGVGVGPAVAHADPVKVLTAAASNVLKEPGKPPRPDQFLYVKTETPDHHVREVWRSIDGTRDGLIGDIKVGGCRDGKAPMYGTNDPRAEGTLEDCRPSPVYRTDLPTTADAMLAYLYQKEDDRPGRATYIGKDVYSLAYEQVLQPASYAALFEAAARVPGLAALDHATDGAGRPGVGITWPVPPGSGPKAKPMVMVFDATTFQFLGTDDSAVMVKTYVNEVGQRS
ncbi:CU044_5270 family protein [Amycolatopsis sp. DG1A-15b]|uniref:CU044_5270 family protein n=1 Tax=Amycolatopsis sp. DG1A-15b TaxID=3052846 RepID=UPI00255BE2B2|nr:CU044_5270 family protein [Amycolatopsis sp. DG1A-15b]WIX90111.1 CU044_5270 family protein [Amycolatopsis sp. DG1A-15b]